MICFAVSRNGQPLATAGVQDGIIMALMTWVQHGSEPANVGFHLGGTDSSGDREQHVEWFDLRDLVAGDEVLVRIEEGPTADPPAHTRAGHEQLHSSSGRKVKCCFCNELRSDKAGVAGAEVIMCGRCLALAAAALEHGLPSLLHLVAAPGPCSFCYATEQSSTMRAGALGICATCVQKVAP
jgi:hypothetical protein